VRMKISFLLIFLLGLPLRPSFCQEQEVLSLSLEECIARALKNNLNVAVEVYNPELADLYLTRAKEVFMPRLDLNYGNEQTENPPYWWITGAGTITSKYADYSASLVQQIPTGGNFSLSLTGYRSDTNQAFQLINPRYGSTVRFDFNQPLLRNFGFKVSRREILVARNNLDISNDQLITVLLDTVYLVQEAYWNLVYSIENFNVKKQSLQLGQDLLAKNKKEVEIGQLAPLEILNAEAVVASREADILQAEFLIKRSEEMLKAVINLSAEGEASLKKIVPFDKPEFIEKEVSLESALKEALDKRPDLKMTKKNIETKELNVSVARNQMLPGLNLQFSYWSPGVSGDRLLYLDNNPFLGVIVGKEKGSAIDSLRDAFKLLYKNWSVGLTLSLPLSNFLTRADYALSKLELEQNLAKLKTLEQQAVLEVSDAVRTIETNAKRVHAYRLARELAQKRLEAEAKKLSVGLSTNYFVLEYQEELANARSMEIKSMVDYNLSLARLEKAMGTSLEVRNIKISQFSRNAE